jgi:hypothetical protein
VLIPAKTRREGENLLGISFIAEDFDDPMPEIEDAFEGKVCGCRSIPTSFSGGMHSPTGSFRDWPPR